MFPSIGDDISIRVSHATAHCAVAVTTIFGTVVDETQNALKIESQTENDKCVTAWFPKKSFTTVIFHNEMKYFSCRFAKWFRPSGWNETFIEICSKNSIISA